MIYLLFGENKYQIRNRVEKIKNNFLKNGGDLINLAILDGKTLNFEEFQAQAIAPGFFFPARMTQSGLPARTSQSGWQERLFIINNLISQGKKEIQEKIKGLLSKDFPSHLIFLEEEKISPQNILFKKIKEIGKVEEFVSLKGENLKRWIIEKIKEKGLKIQKSALELVLVSLGNNLFQLENEIEKLSLYLQEKNKNIIENEDIKILSAVTFNANIFELIDAIAERKTPKAMELLIKFLEQGEDPLSILGMINYQFKNLLMIKSLLKINLTYEQIIQKTGLHPFVVKKTIQGVANFQEEELKEIYKKLLNIDFAIKTGKISGELGLQILVFSLCEKISI